jgi:hypothetical protein
MSRLIALLLLVSVAFLSAAQEAPKPVPAAEDKKAEPKKDASKPDEKPPEGEEIDVHKTADRIADNAQKAGDRLKKKDPGAETRKIQEEIIKDIDALIKKAQNPPPPMNSDTSPMPPPPKSDMMPPPMGNSGGQTPPKNGMGGGMPPKSPMGTGSGGSSGGGKADRPPRRQRKPRGDSPMGMSEPTAKGSTTSMEPMPAGPEPKDAGNEKPSGNGTADRFGKASPKRQNDKLADLYKDVWGHLPDRLRQEMDLYYREKFMPRYSELLRQYYAALAEQRKKGSEDR